jgi:uncharacterized protein YukE
MSDKFKADTEKMKDQAKDYKAQKTETQTSYSRSCRWWRWRWIR